jgi:DNA-binding response OmpR family regulator
MKHYILYAEDELILGQLVQEALEKAGYDVLRCRSATDALRQFRQRRPHLALLDIMMPDDDGYTLATQIRALDKQLPIIFLTAKVQSGEVVRGFATGCNDYIRKPFSTEELLIRIARWIEERYGNPERAAHDVWTLGNCAFHPQKGLMETPSGEYRLTHKEAEVLRILYTHRGNAVSRDHVLQQVWGEESIYTSRILDVYISKLRKLFRESGNEIITLKGIGYRFITAQ